MCGGVRTYVFLGYIITVVHLNDNNSPPLMNRTDVDTFTIPYDVKDSARIMHNTGHVFSNILKYGKPDRFPGLCQKHGARVFLQSLLQQLFHWQYNSHTLRLHQTILRGLKIYDFIVFLVER